MEIAGTPCMRIIIDETEGDWLSCKKVVIEFFAAAICKLGSLQLFPLGKFGRAHRRKIGPK
jgi:hypothetical protein